MLLANVYIFDFDTMDWKLTNHSVIISNSSDEGSIEREIVGFRYSDGRNISDLEDLSYRQMVMLFWDTDNKILFLFEPTFGNLYLFDTKTLKWSQTNRRIMHHLSFSTRKKQFTVNTGHCVEIFALTKMLIAKMKHRGHFDVWVTMVGHLPRNLFLTNSI